MQIREASAADFDAIWPIFHAVGAAGETYAYPRDVTREQAYALRAGGSWETVREQQPQAGPRTAGHRGEVWTATRGRGILRSRNPPRFRRLELAGVERVNALGAAPGGEASQPDWARGSRRRWAARKDAWRWP